MKCIKKSYMNGGSYEPTNRDMRDSDRASRESYRMARPERRMQRNYEDIDRLLGSLEGYDPEDTAKRDMIMRKIIPMLAGVAAVPATAAAYGGMQDARNQFVKNRNPLSNESMDLNALQKILIDLFGIGAGGQ